LSHLLPFSNIVTCLQLYEEDAWIGHRDFDLKITQRVKMSMVKTFIAIPAKLLIPAHRLACQKAVLTSGPRKCHPSVNVQSLTISLRYRKFIAKGHYSFFYGITQATNARRQATKWDASIRRRQLSALRCDLLRINPRARWVKTWQRTRL
jgi:hypothetical protein